MTNPQTGTGLTVEALTSAIENFNRFYIRLPVAEKLPFTTLSVLDTLALRGPLRLTELARREQLSQPGVTQLVTRLQHDGLVERRPDPKDRRVVMVGITEEGRRIRESRRTERGTQLEPLLTRLTAEERQAIAEALPALTHLAALAEASREHPPSSNVPA